MITRHSLQKALSIAALASVTVGGAACSSTNTPSVATPSSAMMTTPSMMPTTSTHMMPMSHTMMMAYKSGTYTVDGSYTSPAGPEMIAVKLTLKDNIVTSAEVTPKAVAPMSQRFQGQFISGYEQYVIGKNIDQINVSVVSGSSLTPQGFNDALAKIKAQAKS